MEAPQDEESVHYSYGIPSKNTDDYELLNNFDSVSDLDKWLSKEYGANVSSDSLKDSSKRDVYGDLNIKLNSEDYDLAIKQSGDFLLYFDSPQTNEVRELVKARDIWDQFIEGNYRTAEPGIIFWTTMSDYSPSNYVGRPIICTNPCAEVPLEDGGACNLGSINLSRFIKDGFTDRAQINWDQLAESTRILVRFLDNVVTWNEDLNALEKQRLAAKETRRLGLGVMGIADMLNQMGLAYDSEDGIALITETMKFITNAAYQASAVIGGEKGSSPIFNEENYMKCPFVHEALSKETQLQITENGLRNIAIMSIAPTGSISNIVLSYQDKDKNYIGVSGGVEPIFATHYTRRSESFGNKFFKVFHSTIQAYIDKFDLQEKVDNSADIEDVLPDYLFRTAHKVNSSQRVDIQGLIQKYIDHSISSTINLPEDIKPEIISDIYLQAWKAKLKGVTIYRDGSRFPILSTDENELTDFQKNKDKEFEITNNNNETIKAKGDEIIKLPDGTLTTMYHYMKNSETKIEEIIESEKFQNAE
jgi:ribonucleoside-diphosphate reductase alpha chain